MTQKLIHRALPFYLLLKLLNTLIVSIFSEDFFRSDIFSRKETLKINNIKIAKTKTGNKVKVKKLLYVKKK